MSLAALASLSLADGNANDGSPLLVAVESRALKRAAESQAPAALQTSQVAAPPPAGAPPTDLIGALARIREDIARFRDTPPDQRDADAVRPALEDPLNVLLASPADLAASLPTNVSSSHYFAFLEDSKDLARDVASLRSSFLTRHAALHLGYLLAEASPTIPEGTPLSELLDAHFISLKANPYAALVACSSVLARGAQANHGEAVKRAASLLSRLFAGRSLLDFYTYLESLSRIEGGSVRQSAGMPNDSGRHTRHQRSLWEEFTDLACAAPDRVASSLTEADESMWHDNFFAKLGVDLEHAVFAVSLRESKGLAEAARAFGTLIAKLGRLNRLDALFGTCLPVIWKRITGPVGEDYVKAWSAVLSNAGDLEKPAEALVRAIDSKVLTANSDAKVIRELAERLVVPLLGNSTGFAHLFGDKFLLRRTFSANSLRLFYASLDVANLRPNGDREWHLKAMLALLRTWTSKAWIGGVGDARHLYTTQAVLALVPYFWPRRSVPDPALFSSELRYLFISGFGTYLSATEPAIRTRGMVVGEEISKIVSASFAKEGSSEAKVVLDFELEGDDVEALRRLARENVSDDSGKTVSEVLFQTSPATVPTLSIAPETVAPTLGVDDRDPDSDDESNFGSEDSFIPYDFEPDEFPTGPVTDQTISVSRPQPFVPPRKQAVKGQDRVKIAPPVYVRELVSYLRAGNEDVTKQEMALVHCLSVVRAMKDLDWKEHGVELITWLLRAEDNFELDGFHAMRQEAMREVASRGPSTVVPALVSAFYDRTLAISQRLEVLDVLASAAAALSSLADDPADDDPTLLKPTVNAASSPHQEDTEKIAERIAGSTRRFSKKSLAERSKKPPKPNKWSKHAETAVLGLVGRLGSRANGWDPTRNAGTEMPLVLDRLLACATAMVWCSANIPSLPRLCRELFDFAWSLRSLRTANEQQWGASDDSDFDVAIPRSNIPSTVALAVTVSFSMLSQVSYGQVGTLDLFNSVFSDAEVERAASWAIDLMEDGTGGQDHREKAIALVSVIREVLEARRREIFGEDVAEIL